MVQENDTSYVGLINPGCICYLNSVLQQLFMIPTFREGILKAEDKIYEEERTWKQFLNEQQTSMNQTTGNINNLLLNLKQLFLQLILNNKKSANPSHFCHAFKDQEGNPTNLYEQKDCSEFLRFILERIEKLLEKTSDKDLVSSHFEGKICHEIISEDCDHKSSREENFISINLVIKDKQNIEECLKDFVKGELLKGSNAYYCEQCDKKVTALKKDTLKYLPNNLIIVLNRFDFNYEIMQRRKINDELQYPKKLNLQQFTKFNSNDPNNKNENLPKIDQDYFDFKLSGVIVHNGFAGSGHYYSLIKDREDRRKPEHLRWLQFNDNQVTKYNLRYLEDETFGEGKHMNNKFRNAYILFYERENKFQHISNKKKIKEGDDKNNSSNEIQVVRIKEKINENEYPICIREKIEKDEIKQIPKFLIQNIYKDNRCESQIQIIFNEEAQQFYNSLFQITQVFSFSHFKYTVLFSLTKQMRERNNQQQMSYLQGILKNIKLSLQASQWFLQIFSNEQILFEFFLNLNKVNAIFIQGLITTAVQTIYQSEENGFIEGQNGDNKLINETLKTFIKVLLNNISVFVVGRSIHFINIYLKLLFEMTIIGEKIRIYMAKKKLIEKLIAFYQYQVLNQINDQNTQYLFLSFEVKVHQTELVPIKSHINLQEENFKLFKRIKKDQQQQNQKFQSSYFWLLVSKYLESFDFSGILPNPNKQIPTLQNSYKFLLQEMFQQKNLKIILYRSLDGEQIDSVKRIAFQGLSVFLSFLATQSREFLVLILNYFLGDMLWVDYKEENNPFVIQFAVKVIVEIMQYDQSKTSKEERNKVIKQHLMKQIFEFENQNLTKEDYKDIFNQLTKSAKRNKRVHKIMSQESYFEEYDKVLKKLINKQKKQVLIYSSFKNCEEQQGNDNEIQQIMHQYSKIQHIRKYIQNFIKSMKEINHNTPLQDDIYDGLLYKNIKVSDIIYRKLSFIKNFQLFRNQEQKWEKFTVATVLPGYLNIIKNGQTNLKQQEWIRKDFEELTTFDPTMDQNESQSGQQSSIIIEEHKSSDKIVQGTQVLITQEENDNQNSHGTLLSTYSQESKSTASQKSKGSIKNYLQQPD